MHQYCLRSSWYLLTPYFDSVPPHFEEITLYWISRRTKEKYIACDPHDTYLLVVSIGYRKIRLPKRCADRFGNRSVRPPKIGHFRSPCRWNHFQKKKVLYFMPSQNESYWDVHDSDKILHVWWQIKPVKVPTAHFDKCNMAIGCSHQSAVSHHCKIKYQTETYLKPSILCCSFIQAYVKTTLTYFMITAKWNTNITYST